MKSILRIYNYDIYLKEFFILFFCYLLVEPSFSWIFIQNSSITGIYVKVLSLLVYPFVLMKFKEFKTSEKIYIGLFSMLIVKLIFESLFEYGSVFQYYEVYGVIFPVILVVFIKWLLRKLNLDLLEFIVHFYVITYVVFMVLFGRQFSLGLADIDMADYGPFSGDTRILHAQSIFMMVIPFLWYLNKYVITKKIKYLGFFLFCFMIILLHQHRSVWSSSIVAISFYFLTIVRSNPKAFSGTVKFLVISLFMVSISFVLISSLYPELLDYFSQRFSEILNPGKEEGTANFRIDQSVTYFQYIIQRPLLGWTFDGFELDNPLVDWWPEKSGQHFHEGYIEILYYHGVFGILLKYSFLLYILIRSFGKKLSEESVVLSSFCISGLIFSLSYVLPTVFWGHVGMCLYYLERDQLTGKLPFARSPIIKT